MKKNIFLIFVFFILISSVLAQDNLISGEFKKVGFFERLFKPQAIAIAPFKTTPYKYGESIRFAIDGQATANCDRARFNVEIYASGNKLVDKDFVGIKDRNREWIKIRNGGYYSGWSDYSIPSKGFGTWRAEAWIECPNDVRASRVFKTFFVVGEDIGTCKEEGIGIPYCLGANVVQKQVVCPTKDIITTVTKRCDDWCDNGDCIVRPKCGDGSCNGDEDSDSCSTDCGSSSGGGGSQLNNCGDLGGKTCDITSQCFVDVIVTDDTPNCCLGGCEEQDKDNNPLCTDIEINCHNKDNTLVNYNSCDKAFDTPCPTCEVENDCAENYECKQSSCLIKDDAHGYVCESDNQCAEGESCKDNTCKESSNLIWYIIGSIIFIIVLIVAIYITSKLIKK